MVCVLVALGTYFGKIRIKPCFIHIFTGYGLLKCTDKATQDFPSAFIKMLARLWFLQCRAMGTEDQDLGGLLTRLSALVSHTFLKILILISF